MVATTIEMEDRMKDSVLVFRFETEDELFDWVSEKRVDGQCRLVLESLRNYLRSKIKYTDEVGSFKEVSDELYALLDDANIDI